MLLERKPFSGCFFCLALAPENQRFTKSQQDEALPKSCCATAAKHTVYCIRLGLYSHYRCKEIAAETVGTVIHIVVLCYLLVGSRCSGNLWKIVAELKSLPGQHKLEDT